MEASTSNFRFSEGSGNALFSLICVLVALGAKYLLDRRKFGRFPPGPKGLPLVGNFFDMKRLVAETKFHYQAWNRLAKLYGPVVGIRLGLSDPMIIVSGKEAVMKMLNKEEFDGRPDGFLFRHRTLGVRRGVIFTDGAVWKEQRRFSLKCLRDFGFGRKTMEEMILNEAVTLTRIVEAKSKRGPIKNINKMTTVAVLNSLWILTTNTRYDQEKEDDGVRDIVQIIHDIFKDSDVSGGLLSHFPFLRHIIPTISGYTSRDQRQNRMWNFFSKLVSEHKTSLNLENGNRDLIDAYLSEIEQQKFNSSSSFNELQLIALIKDLFTAGIETTNNSIGFILLYLIAYPDVQEKLHHEIDKVLGKEALPSVEARSRMPYLNATITEISRLSNIGPTTIPHRATADTEFMGFDIKKNYILLANLNSIHMDKDHWGDPETFRPERFLDDNGQFINNDPWMVPFGSGRRKCLGENLAKNSQFIFISCLLQKLRFEIPPGEILPPLQGVNGFTIAPPNFNVIAFPR